MRPPPIPPMKPNNHKISTTAKIAHNMVGSLHGDPTGTRGRYPASQMQLQCHHDTDMGRGTQRSGIRVAIVPPSDGVSSLALQEATSCVTPLPVVLVGPRS